MCALVHLHIGTLGGPDHIKPVVDALVTVLFATHETGSIIHKASVPLSSGGVLKTGHLTYLHSKVSKRRIPRESETAGFVLTWHFTSLVVKHHREL